MIIHNLFRDELALLRGLFEKSLTPAFAHYNLNLAPIHAQATQINDAYAALGGVCVVESDPRRYLTDRTAEILDDCLAILKTQAMPNVEAFFDDFIALNYTDVQPIFPVLPFTAKFGFKPPSQTTYNNWYQEWLAQEKIARNPKDGFLKNVSA